VATAIFRFDRSNGLQAIWPVAGQIVTAYPKILNSDNRSSSYSRKCWGCFFATQHKTY